MPTGTYGRTVDTPVGRLVARRAGLPRPVLLERHTPGDPVIRGRVLLGAAPGSRGWSARFDAAIWHPDARVTPARRR